MPMRLLADQPIEGPADDALGFAPSVESLRRALAGAETPMVAGLLGDSGAGKTSVLRLLEAQLRQQREAEASALVPIWFNARQYQNNVNPIYPLLYTLRHAYQSDRRITALAGPRGFGGMLSRVAALSALAATDVGLQGATRNLASEQLPLKDLREQLEVVRQQPDQLEGILRGWADTVSQLRTGFEALLGTFASDLARADPRLKVEGVRFAILVDDLDRCAPETMLAMLENLRQFLTVRRAIFVLAVNPDVVSQALWRLRGGAVDARRQWLAAQLHVTFPVPEPTPELVRLYARERLAPATEAENPARQALLARCADDFSRVLEECRVSNPRQVKHLVNACMRFLDQHAAQLEQFSMPNVARLLALAEIEPGLFQAYQAEAEKVSAELMALGTPEFSLAAFEQAHGVWAHGPYPRLVAMRQLFQLKVDETRPGLQQQVDAVHALTRWG
jgi:hypothetical protein